MGCPVVHVLLPLRLQQIKRTPEAVTQSMNLCGTAPLLCPNGFLLAFPQEFGHEWQKVASAVTTT